MSRFLAQTGTVTLHVVSDTGQADTSARVVRLLRLDSSGKLTKENLAAKFSGLTAQLQYGRYRYDVESQRLRSGSGTLEVFGPKVFLLIDCGRRESDMNHISGPLIINRGKVVPPPVAKGRSWITFVSATGYGLALVENNRPVTVQIAADGRFEVYGLREGRYVALVFRDGDLMKSFEFQLDKMWDPRPLVFRLDGKAPSGTGGDGPRRPEQRPTGNR